MAWPATHLPSGHHSFPLVRCLLFLSPYTEQHLQAMNKADVINAHQLQLILGWPEQSIWPQCHSHGNEVQAPIAGMLWLNGKQLAFLLWSLLTNCLTRWLSPSFFCNYLDYWLLHLVFVWPVSHRASLWNQWMNQSISHSPCSSSQSSLSVLVFFGPDKIEEPKTAAGCTGVFVGGRNVLYYLHIGRGKTVLSVVHKILPLFGRLNTCNLLWCYPRNIKANKPGLKFSLRQVVS